MDLPLFPGHEDDQSAVAALYSNVLPAVPETVAEYTPGETSVMGAEVSQLLKPPRK